MSKTPEELFTSTILINRSMAKIQECVTFIPEAIRTKSETEDSWKKIAYSELNRLRELIEKL